MSHPMIYQGLKRYPVREIVIHCADTLPDWLQNKRLSAGSILKNQFNEIKRWHTSAPPVGRGWNDFAYHWLIGRSGGLMAGRLETTIGSGVLNHNAGVIHCCLVGGHGSAATDDFGEHFTDAQSWVLRQLIRGIGTRTKITHIAGHNEYAAKACPGFNVPAWLAKHGGRDKILGY